MAGLFSGEIGSLGVWTKWPNLFVKNIVMRYFAEDSVLSVSNFTDVRKKESRWLCLTYRVGLFEAWVRIFRADHLCRWGTKSSNWSLGHDVSGLFRSGGCLRRRWFRFDV